MQKTNKNTTNTNLNRLHPKPKGSSETHKGIQAYAVEKGQRFYKKVWIEITSKEIIVSSKNGLEQLFRAPLEKLIIGNDFATISSQSSHIRSTVIKSSTDQIHLRFVNSYYAAFLLIGLIFLYFAILSILRINPFGLTAVFPFTLVIVPAMFRYINKLNKTRKNFESFADAIEQAMASAKIQFAAEGNEIAAIVSEGAERQINAERRAHIGLAFPIAGIMFFFGLISIWATARVITARFLSDYISVIFSLVTAVIITSLGFWSYFKTVKSAANRHQSDSMEAIKDRLLSDEELAKLRLSGWELIQAGWKQILYFVIIPFSIMLPSIFIFEPKIDIAKSREVSHQFVAALQNEDYINARKYMCKNVKEDVSVFYQNIKTIGEDSFESLQNFRYVSMNPLSPQLVQFVYKNPRYPKLSFDTVVGLENKTTCVNFAVLPLGFASVDIGKTDHDYLREPGIDEPRKPRADLPQQGK